MENDKNFPIVRKYVTPVNVNRVHGCLAELGDLEVVLFDIQLVLEVSLAVGDKSASIPHANEVSCVALQLKASPSFLLWTDPSLAEVNDVSLVQGGVNPDVLHVWSKSSNVQGSYPHLAKMVLVPLPRVVVQGPGNFQCEQKYLMK